MIRDSIKILAFLLIVAAGAADVRAQAVAEDTLAPASPWTLDLVNKLSASQAGYRDWTKGGVNTLAFTSVLDGKATRKGILWEQNHDVRLAYGLVKQDTLEFRKADDQIRFNSSLQYRGSGLMHHLNPTIAAQINTQFDAGYNYKKNPFGDGRQPPVKVSDFFSPATFSQSIGLTYDPNEWFTVRAGVGAKETVVVIERFRTLYGMSPDRLVKVEVGLESRTTIDRELAENIRLQSTLGLFAAFNKPDLPDLMWENTLAMKVNSWLGVNFEFVMLYDRDISRALQMKEVLSLGITIVMI